MPDANASGSTGSQSQLDFRIELLRNSQFYTRNVVAFVLAIVTISWASFFVSRNTNVTLNPLPPYTGDPPHGSWTIRELHRTLPRGGGWTLEVLRRPGYPSTRGSWILDVQGRPWWS